MAGQCLRHGSTDALLVGELPGQPQLAVVPARLHGVRVSRRGQGPGQQFLGGEAQPVGQAGDHLPVAVVVPERASADQRGLADAEGPEHRQDGDLLLDEFDQLLRLVRTAVEDGEVLLSERQQFAVRAVRQQPSAQLGPLPGEGLHGEGIAGPSPPADGTSAAGPAPDRVWPAAR